jgi:hypothetical protein
MYVFLQESSKISMLSDITKCVIFIHKCYPCYYCLGVYEFKINWRKVCACRRSNSILFLRNCIRFESMCRLLDVSHRNKSLLALKITYFVPVCDIETKTFSKKERFAKRIHTYYFEYRILLYYNTIVSFFDCTRRRQCKAY